MKKRILILIGIMQIAVFLTAHPIHSNASYAVIVSMTQTPWISRGDGSVKWGGKPGDLIFTGDRIDIHNGGGVTISYDKDSLNVTVLEGPSQMEIIDLSPVNIRLSKGRMTTLLDNSSTNRHFKIVTPSTEAEAYGTHYQVQVRGEQTEVLTYEGTVRVAGLKKGSQKPFDHVYLHSGDRTSILKQGLPPAQPTPIPSTQLKEMDKIRTDLHQMRNWLRETGFKARSDITPNRTPANPQPVEPASKEKTKYLF